MKFLKVGGFLVAGFGLLILLNGRSSGVVPGIIFTLIVLLTLFVGVGAIMNLLVWSYLAIPLSALIIYLTHQYKYRILYHHYP